MQTDMDTIKVAAVNVSPYLTSAGMGADITTFDGFLGNIQGDFDDLKKNF